MENLLKAMTLDFFGTGQHKISAEKLLEKENVLLLDVRSTPECRSIPLAFEPFNNITCLNIPLDELPDRLSEVSDNAFIAIFCPANVRSTMAYAFLRLNGFDTVKILLGGYGAITEAIKPGKILKMVKKQQRN